jgi:hypothetical protein
MTATDTPVHLICSALVVVIMLALIAAVLAEIYTGIPVFSRFGTEPSKFDQVHVNGGKRVYRRFAI